jgi:hypothetical protein
MSRPTFFRSRGRQSPKYRTPDPFFMLRCAPTAHVYSSRRLFRDSQIPLEVGVVSPARFFATGVQSREP